MSKDLYKALWIVGLVVLFITVLLIGSFPLRNDNDTWWHLKTGKVLLESGNWFPEHDFFTYTAENIPWANHEWLIDILMYKGYQALGLKGLIILKGAILGLTFVLVAWLGLRYSGSVPAALLFALVGGIGSRYSIHLRPQILTNLALIIFLHLLLNVRRRVRPKTSLAIMVLMAIPWINLHGGGILSVVVMGLAVVGTFAEWGRARWISKDGEAERRERGSLAYVIIGGVLVALATLCNPFTYDIHLLTARVMGDKGLVRHIIELQVPNLHYAGGYLALIMATVVLFALAHRRLDFTNLFLVVFFFYQSINYIRHLPLFCIVAPPLLAALPFRVLPDSYLIPERVRGRIRWGTLAVFAGLSLFEIRKDVQDNWLPLVNSKGGYLPEVYPSLAVKVIKQFRPEGRMFNQINYAGFLIWELAPEEYKLFTDPRFDIFGSQFMHESHAVQDAIVYPVPPYRTEKMPEDDWRKKMEEFYAYNSALSELGIDGVPLWRFLLWKWDAGFLVLDAQSVLASVLHNGDGDWDPDAYERDGTDLNLDKFPRWREVFYDGKYGIYVKDIPKNQDLTKKRVEAWAVGEL